MCFVSEALLTYLAAVGLLAGVDPHVDFAVGAAAEPLAAHFAGERLLARVGPHMDHQAGAGGVGLSTGLARVQLLDGVLGLAGVDLHVVAEVSLVAESPPTGLAGVRLFARVDSHVDLQVGAAGEVLAAGLAGEGLLTRVRPHVDHQAGSARVLFATGVAGVQLLLGLGALRPGRVHSSVIPEVCFVGEGLSAGFAGVRPLARMDSKVNFQVEPAAELLSAGLAGVGLFDQMRPQVTSQRRRVLKYLSTSAADVRLLEEGELILRARLNRRLISTGDEAVSMATRSLECGSVLWKKRGVITKLLILREGRAGIQELLTVPLRFTVGDRYQRDVSFLL